MTETQALALLVLRRLHGRMTISASASAPAGDTPDPDPGADLGVLTGGDRVAIGRVLRRAIERSWLTLEILFSQDAVAARLGRAGQQTLDAIFREPCFDHLSATPAPFRHGIGQELHAARKFGPLLRGEVDAEDLLRQVSGLAPSADPRATQDLEWYALWQMAGDLAREGYPNLRSVIEARSADRSSLLVGLAVSFVPFELELEGYPLRADFGSSLLSAEHLRWLCEHSEPVEELLNGVYAGGTDRVRASPDEVAARVRQGQSFAHRGEYERAVIEFTAAIQADPSAATAYVHRGDAYRLRGEYDRAVADYTQALRLDPNNLPAYLNRGLAHRLLGQPEAAVVDLSEAIRIDPRSVPALNGRGAAHADLGRYDLAAADHSEAIRLDPSLAWSYQSRGDAFAGLSEYDRAIADYSQALRLNPHFPLARTNRGDAYRLSGDFERAAADYSEALRLDPTNPRVFISRAEAYRRQGQYELALADYAEAIRLDPTNPTSYVGRGTTYQLAGEYDRAVADFDRAEQFDAANPAVFYQRALAYQHQKSYEQALADLGRAIELNPRDAVAFISRGSLYALKEDLNAAAADFTEAIRLDPTSTQARLERGRTYAQRGEFPQALADCADALRIDPQFIPALLVRGGVFLRTGESAAALEEYNRAVEINPRYAKAYNDRGVANSRLGQLDAAVEDFNRAIQLQPDYAQALSNRANAYQLQNRHDLALRDFARAVVLDSKYAAAYCVQRGLHEIRRRRAKLALADFAVALTIDPNNRTAKAGREEAQVLAETDFHVTSEADVYRSAEHTPLAEREPPLKAELVEESADETPQRPAVATGFDMNAATQAAGGPGRAGLLAESPLPGAVPIEVPASLAQEVEERQFRQEQEKLRLAAVEAKAAELRKKNEEEEKKRKELAKKRKRKEDPEERALRMRKYKRYAIIAAGLVVVLYYGAQLVMALIPKPESPFDEYTAEELIEQYAKDTIAADDKFADQRICLRGRIKVVQEKGKGLIPPKVFFESAGHSEVRVEVQFANEDVVSALKDRQEYRINGKMSRFKPGVGLTMKDANLMPHQPGAGGASVRFRWDDRWLAAGSRRGVLLPPDPLFHAIHLMPSYDRHNCPLMITPTNEPRRDAALGGPERPTVTLIL